MTLQFKIYKSFILSFTKPMVEKEDSRYLMTSLMALAWQRDVIQRLSAVLEPEDMAYETYCADAITLVTDELSKREKLPAPK